MATNPEVQHGKQPAQNPEVTVSGPLGEKTVRIGDEHSPTTPDATPDETAEETPEQAPEETADDDRNPGIVADYQGGDETPEPDVQPDADDDSADDDADDDGKSTD